MTESILKLIVLLPFALVVAVVGAGVARQLIDVETPYATAALLALAAAVVAAALWIGSWI